MDEPLAVTTDGFVVLGLGFATLVSQNGQSALAVADGLSGVRIASVLLEARADYITLPSHHIT